MLKLIRTAAAIPLIAFAGVMAGPATADDHSPGQGRIVEPGAAVLTQLQHLFDTYVAGCSEATYDVDQCMSACGEGTFRSREPIIQPAHPRHLPNVLAVKVRKVLGD